MLTIWWTAMHTRLYKYADKERLEGLLAEAPDFVAEFIARMAGASAGQHRTYEWACLAARSKDRSEYREQHATS